MHASRRWIAVVTTMVATLALASQGAYGATFADGFEGYPAGQVWPDGTTHGPWVAEFNGYGATSITQDGSNALSLSPAASQSPGETHAALVRTSQSFGDVDLTVRLRTVSQLRNGTPHPWEVGWVLWHYGDNTHFYYVALKPNGWELGKEDPAYPGAQRFLGGDYSPTFAVGSWHTVRIQQSGATMTISADGTTLGSVTDGERPYASGAVGLYAEDAQVHVDSVSVNS
jgi:hypothetical protein